MQLLFKRLTAMKITEFKSLIKSIFNNDKVSFKEDIAGTSFSSDGTVIIKASIKKGWNYEIPKEIEKLFISKNINMGFVNDQLRLSHYSIDKRN